jgi:hypothetical protein
MPNGRIVQDSKIKTTAEANARAKRIVEDALRESVDVSFDSVPVPLLDLGDLVHVETSDASIVFRLQSFSFPLVVGSSATMTIGTHKNVMYRVRHTRHHPRPRHPRRKHHK